MSQTSESSTDTNVEEERSAPVAAQLSFHSSVWHPIVLFRSQDGDGGPQDAGYQIVNFLRSLTRARKYKVMAKRLNEITWRWVLADFPLKHQRRLPESLCALDLKSGGYLPHVRRGPQKLTLEMALSEIYEGKIQRLVDMRLYDQKYITSSQWRYILNFENRTLTVSAPQNMKDDCSLVFPFAYLVENGRKYMRLAEIFLTGHPSTQAVQVMKLCQRSKIVEIQVREQPAPDHKQTFSPVTPPPFIPPCHATQPRTWRSEINYEVKQAVSPPAQNWTPLKDKSISVTCVEVPSVAPENEIEERDRSRLQIKRLLGEEAYEIFMANLPASRLQ